MQLDTEIKICESIIIQYKLFVWQHSINVISFTANLSLKKFELMLTRRAKAYSSSCSQTVSLSPAISSQFILGVCAAAEDRKSQ